MPRRTRQYEDEPEQTVIMTGSVVTFSQVPATDKPKKKDQIGFIRQKKCRSKTTNARTAKK